MYSNKSSSGGAVAGVIIVAIIIALIGTAVSGASNKSSYNSSNSKTPSSTQVTPPTPKIETPKVKTPEPVELPETWKCQDDTSYDRNPNNDNLCISSKGTRKHVSDCEAVRLDPDYSPSQRGASYYNGCAR
ncbi:MAG: hypothetical protein Q4A96_01185 [Candidatus Saccharibacteria bacterium]|nr:hypothetical protein [Candidatus Saccharibacteria bacterium]